MSETNAEAEGRVVIGPCECGGYGVLYNDEWKRRLGRCHDTAVSLRERGWQDARSMGLMQDHMAELLRILGLGDHARPETPAHVMEHEIIPAVRALASQRRWP